MATIEDMLELYKSGLISRGIITKFIENNANPTITVPFDKEATEGRKKQDDKRRGWITPSGAYITWAEMIEEQERLEQENQIKSKFDLLDLED